MTAPPAPTTAPAPHRFRDRQAWERWLRAHHATSDGAWLQLAKVGAGEPGLSYAEALEVALCWGWIDGQKKGLDAQSWLQRFTPRRARSLWSKINRAKAEALIADGRMQPAGLAEVERARRDGRWDEAYDGARASVVPPDLQAAFDANRRAADFFATLDGANRYAVLWRVQTAKRPETRAKRIATLVDMLARGEKIHER
jgi:uncharacterized protein YdeI (YjbR/CyaY-like superfamily)